MDSVGPRAMRPQRHDPPLLFHLEHDPSEAHPLVPLTDEYRRARATIEAAMRAHEAGVAVVPNQMAKGGDNDKTLCCDRDSKKKFPKLPACTCDAANFRAWVCAPVGPTASARVGADGAVLIEEQEHVAREADAAGGGVDPDDVATWPVLPPMHLQEA